MPEFSDKNKLPAHYRDFSSRLTVSQSSENLKREIELPVLDPVLPTLETGVLDNPKAVGLTRAGQPVASRWQVSISSIIVTHEKSVFRA